MTSGWRMPPRSYRAEAFRSRGLEATGSRGGFGFRPRQLAVGLPVTQRAVRLAETLPQTREIVVRVARLRIGRNRPLVGLRRGVRTPGVLERHAQIERGGGVLGPRFQGMPVVRLGFFEPAGLVEQTPEVHVGVG